MRMIEVTVEMGNLCRCVDTAPAKERRAQALRIGATVADWLMTYGTRITVVAEEYNDEVPRPGAEGAKE